MDKYKKILTALNIIAPLDEDGSLKQPAVYFLGIGGIGMSALARYFKSIGVTVSGYDKTVTPLTSRLSEEGINIHYEDSIPLLDKNAQVIIYTPAIPKGHSEYNYYKDHNYTVVKRSDVLGAITNSSFNICIAGTHGKTTTSTMVAHILRHSGFGCNAFLGGISGNYDTNFWSSDNDVCVVEADEYDRSFLKLSPDVAIITSMDPDHLDIYGTAENMEDAFIEFASKLKPGGLLISKYGLERSNDLKAAHHTSYDLDNSKAGLYASDVEMINGSYRFNVVVKNDEAISWQLKNVVLNMGGMHNIENVLAAIMVAHHLKIEDDKIINAVADFKGVKRRFEYVIKNEDLVLIDDYAHHPEELRALITGAKNLFPGKKCTVIFQPHLFSRTKDFAAGFAEVLDLADEVLLLPIYPARELPMEGVASEIILDLMTSKQAGVVSKEEALIQIGNNINELVIIAGAGDIDTLVEPLKVIIELKLNEAL